MQAGTIEIRRPRVRGLEERFESRILPLFERRTKAVGELLPELYLHGLSLGDFELALRGLLGEGAPLSPSSIERLRAKWQQEHDEWAKRPLSDLRLVYLWADGVYVKAGLEKEKAALLVVIGATVDGQKHVLSVVPGHRESKESWAYVFRDLKMRGLKAPKLMTADGNSGVWGALSEVWPQAGEQRCWNHKIVNVLDQLPKKTPGRGASAADQDSVRVDARRGREGEGRFRAALSKKSREGRDDSGGRLGADAHFLRLPPGALEALAHDECHREPLRRGPAQDGGFEAFQEGGQCHGADLESADGRRDSFRRLNAPKLLLDVYEGHRFANGRPVTHANSTTIMEAAA